VSEENVAIVKSCWAGWRQGLQPQMERDLGDGVAEQIAEWTKSAGNPDLQPEDFVDNGHEILVHAYARGREERLTFRYTLSGRTIVGWDVV
jgi:hypothetical protein